MEFRRVAAGECRRAPEGLIYEIGLAVADDDDLWAPRKLELQLMAAREGGNDWVYGGVVEVDERGMLLAGDPPPSPDVLLAQLVDRNLMPAILSAVESSATLGEIIGSLKTVWGEYRPGT